MEETLYKLDIFRHRPISGLYGRLFNESFRLYYLHNIFIAFAV